MKILQIKNCNAEQYTIDEKPCNTVTSFALHLS